MLFDSSKCVLLNSKLEQYEQFLDSMSVLLLWIVLAITAASIGSIVLVSGLALWVGAVTLVEQAGIIWRSMFSKIMPPSLLRSLVVSLQGLAGLGLGYDSSGWWALCVGLTWLICGFDLLLIEFVLRLLDRNKRLPQHGLFSWFWGVAATCLLALTLGYLIGAIARRQA